MRPSTIIKGVILLVLLVVLMTGCKTVPCTYVQWQHELRNMKQCKDAGVPYVGLHTIRKQVEEMREAVKETDFTNPKSNE